jgi:MarR family transcriptional regulator for hemolysin
MATRSPTKLSPRRELGFLLSDVARQLRTVVDQRASEVGMTRAQWSVLSRLERTEGLKQNDLAAIVDIAPVTLGRIVDRLMAHGLVVRQTDPEDRRINRLFLTPAAHPVLERLGAMGEAVMADALAGLDDATIGLLSVHLTTIKGNLKACHKLPAPDAGIGGSS